VSKHDKADKDGKVSYINLSSEGILNLEKVADSASFYVRMPYIWIVILTSLLKLEVYNRYQLDILMMLLQYHCDILIKIESTSLS
jgi:hypothetical protein